MRSALRRRSRSTSARASSSKTSASGSRPSPRSRRRPHSQPSLRRAEARRRSNLQPPSAAAAKPIATPAPKVPEKTAKPAHTPSSRRNQRPSRRCAIMPPPIRITGASNVPPPELDSTQTIRALTNAEMEDAAQEKWFAVQLAVSDQPVNLDAMPRLDIFEAYRLYSVATAGSGKIVHSLRLGFFKEAVSAEAVMGYLQHVLRLAERHARQRRRARALQGCAVDEEAGRAGAGSEGRRAEQCARRAPGRSDRDDGSGAGRRHRPRPARSGRSTPARSRRARPASTRR